MNEIRLGVLGLSAGNGHPYSWSAIFNGYDDEHMKECPFPVIYSYLKEKKFPDSAIEAGKVTHIWTQDREISEKVSKASRIPIIVDNPLDMIGKVDAILLARDDAENHFQMAEPFLVAGLPVFIDKPLAYSVEEAKKIFSLEKYEGQIFTCSSLTYAQELILSEAQRREVGTIKQVIATVPKDWPKYAVHIIDPVINNLGNQGKIEAYSVFRADDKVTLNVRWESGLSASFSTLGNAKAPIQYTYTGENGSVQLTFKDTFEAFKSSLLAFTTSIKEKKRMIPVERTLEVVNLIELGLKG